MKWLSPTAHGALDYMLIIFLAMAPTAESATGIYAAVCYGLAGAYLLVVLATTDSMGVVEIIPYRAHGWLELVSGLIFIASPFLFRFSAAHPTARVFFMGYGAALLLLWWLTDWSGKAYSEIRDGVTHNLRGQPLPAHKRHRAS
ncbi:hypothetical protein [uncultured Hymenobacter sp.]|uniref:hypothetical protein n=1 Tax=uncultured Hymenobacter sp. TaxID=170016 RepID=UPI0035C949CE